MQSDSGPQVIHIASFEQSSYLKAGREIIEVDQVANFPQLRKVTTDFLPPVEPSLHAMSRRPCE